MPRYETVKLKFRETKKLFASFITVLLAVVAFVQIYFSFFVFRQVNDECLWRPRYFPPGDSLVIVIENVKEGGVTWEAGIRDGDTLIAVNNRPITSLQMLEKTLNKLKAGETAYYVVKRGNEFIDAPVRIKKLIPLRTITIELFALIWLITGFILYSSKPDGEVQNKFFNIGILWTLANNAIIYQAKQFLPDIGDSFIEIVNWTWIPAIAFLPPMILDFFWSFPIKRKIIEKKITKRILYGFSLLLIISYVPVKIFVTPPSKDLEYLAEMLVYGISSLLLSAALIVGFFSLYSSYRKITDKRKKKPLRIIVIAYAISLLSMLYVTFLQKIFLSAFFSNPAYYLPVILFVGLPIGFAYAIFKYSFMDVSAVVKNAFFYFVASLFVAAIYFFSIVFIGGSFIQAVEPTYQGLIIGLLFVLFVILFQSTKDKFQEAITRKFYPEQLAFKEALISFSKEIPTVLSFDGVLKETKKILADGLKINAFAIGLYEEKTDEIVIQKYSKLKKTLSGKLFVRTEKIGGLTKNNKKGELPLIEAERFEEYFVNSQLLIENEIQTAVPLIVREKLLGFVFLGVKNSGARFSAADVPALSAVASQVAVALENARMYEAKEKELILRRDLENARNIQRSLLPSEMPEFDKAEIFAEMLPAQWVGGDYFDVIKIDDKRFYAIIGDVSGKGFSASFYMSKLQTMIRLLADEKLNPVEMLKLLNAKIYPSLKKNFFITLSIALFDLEKSVAKFARAGHTPLKICRNKKITDYLPKGIAVGLDSGDAFNKNIEEIEIELNEETLIVFYSDGVTEQMDERSHLSGDELLNRALIENCKSSLKTVWNKIIDSINAFKGSSEQSDDITILLIKIINK